MAASQKKFYMTLAVITVIGLGLIGYVVSRDAPQSEATPSEVQPVADPNALVGREVGVARGSPDAPVVLEEYVDYQCPYCAMVARLTIPDVIERYVETGKVRYVLFDFPVHPGEKSYLAAEAARCAGDQGGFWRMHDMLFARMSQWSAERNPVDEFVDYAEALGLDAASFERCMDERKYRDLILANRRRAEQMGLNSTPSFVVDDERRVTGAIGFDRLAALIEERLPQEP